MQKKVFLLSIIFVSLFHLVSALNPADVSVSGVTGSGFNTDSNNPCGQGPRAAYVGFKITNISTAALTNLRVSLENLLPAGTFALAGGQAATQTIGSLQSGASDVVYWYVTYPCLHNAACTMKVIVRDNNPGTKNFAATITTKTRLAQVLPAISFQAVGVRAQQ